MINHLNEIEKCYPHANSEMLVLTYGILQEMRLSGSDLHKIINLVAFTCNKHYEFGYNSKNQFIGR